jgi:RES domain-containing protein
VPALYLALTIEGAVLEASHGFGRRFPPLTLCEYDVDVSGIVDLTDVRNLKRLRVKSSDLACPWALDVAEGRQPASWRLAEQLIATGASGALTRSFATGATPAMRNLVLWRWCDKRPWRVAVFDPLGRLGDSRR